MRASTLILAACTLVACACSSAPEVTPLAPGERVEVSYRDENAAMSLRNASSTSQGKPDPALKVATDDDVAKLLEALTRIGFFGSASSEVPQHAKAALVVQRNGQTWVRARLPLAQTTPDDIQQFHLCVDVFRHVYDQTPAFHSDPTVRKEDFEGQSQRLIENARRATQGRSGS